jgi:hypothetical protein
MPHGFDQSRPEHTVHHIRMPQGHAHLDEKHDKLGRSPMVGQLPMNQDGTQSQEVDQDITTQGEQ